MSVLENLVGRIPALLEGRQAAELSCAGLPAAPVNRGAGLILENEAAAALGGEGVASARVLLYSNTPLEGDRVRVVGEMPRTGAPESFAEVAVLHGAQVDAELFYQFSVRHQRLIDQPGVMVRNDKQHIMMRFSAEGAERGFVGAAATFLARLHEVYPAVQGVELIFVVGDTALVEQLARINADSAQTMTALKEGVWKERGFDYRSCQLAGHCGSCSDKKTCASVRQMEAKVKLKRRKMQAQAAQA